MRRSAWWLIGFAAAVLIIFAAAVAFRVPLASRAAEAYLAGRGFPDAAVSVSRVGLDGAAVDGLALGPGLPTVARIEAHYRIFGLLGLSLRAVRIDGLRAVVDARDLDAMKRLAGLVPPGSGGGPAAAPGPELVVKDARITLRNVGAGDVTLAFDGSLDLSQARARASLRGSAHGFPEDVLRAGGKAELTLDATVPPDDGRGPPRAEARISARLADGAAEATLRAEAQWLPGERLDFPMPFSADIQAKGLALAGSRVSSVSWKGEGTVAAGAIRLAGPLEARLAVLRAGGLAAEGIALGGKLEVSSTPGAKLVAILAQASARISSPPAVRGVRIRGTLGFGIPSARLERAQGGALALEARIVPEAVDAALALADGNELALRASAEEIEVSLKVADGLSGRAKLQGGAVRIPGRGVAAGKIEATIPFPLGPGGEPAVLSATVRDASSAARFAALTVDARVTPEAEALRLDGSIRLAGPGVAVPVRGRIARSGRDGRIAFGPVALEFRRGALQPAMLGAALGAVTRATGALELSGALSFAPGAPFDGEAGLDFRDLTAEGAFGRVEGLGGTLRLDGLFPPRTAGAQTLSARRAVVGVPLDKPSVRFRLQAAESGPAVLIDRAEGRIAEGLVYLDRSRVDPFAARNALEIGVRGLSLERLLRDWGMQGMSGTGTLSGTIPVVLGPGGVAIRTGTLRTEGGGVLRVDWGSARAALMRQGEQVALMARTLEDFRYARLEITLARPAGGALSLKVTMEGHNPAVKDGYPFRFNINFSGDLEKILAAIREGRRLGADLLRGGLGGAR